MQRFVTHEAISNGVFDSEYTSGTSGYLPWAQELRNSPQVLDLLCQRMESDYLQMRPKNRKAFTFAQLAARCSFPNPPVFLRNSCSVCAQASMPVCNTSSATFRTAS